MPEVHEVAESTTIALDMIANERAPKYPNGRVNLRVECADGFKVSIQASSSHYANDSSGKAPYWSDVPPVHPFVSFELGGTDDPIPELEQWESGGVWAWVPRDAVARMLDAHGGVLAWESANGGTDAR